MSHMAKRRVLIGAALLVLIAATAVITRNAAQEAQGLSDSNQLVTVVVSTEDIPIGARLQSLLKRGIFTEIQIPRYALVATAITDLEQLRGEDYTTAVIMKNEQVLAVRIGSRI